MDQRYVRLYRNESRLRVASPDCNNLVCLHFTCGLVEFPRCYNVDNLLCDDWDWKLPVQSKLILVLRAHRYCIRKSRLRWLSPAPSTTVHSDCPGFLTVLSPTAGTVPRRHKQILQLLYVLVREYLFHTGLYDPSHPAGAFGLLKKLPSHNKGLKSASG